MAITLVSLRSNLSTLLSTYLGTYTFSDDSTAPSVWVGETPEKTRVTAAGIECQIRNFAEIQNQQLLNAANNFGYTYQVILDLWLPIDVNPQSIVEPTVYSLQSSVELILRQYDQSRLYAHRPRQGVALERAIIDIKENLFLS